VTGPAPPGGRRVLVAGVGNVLRGDDGFGPAVVRALDAEGPPPGVHTVELGIGGVSLVLELMDGYDALFLVDAVDRRGPPGSLYVLEPELPDVAALPGEEQRRLAGDLHDAVPARTLLIARASGVLPPVVRIVGCQPAETEELSTELTPAVARAVPRAVHAIRELVATLGGAAPDPLAALARRDEVLQVMFWLQGEGLGPDVAAEDIVRFVDDEPAVAAALDWLVDAGHAERVGERAGAGAPVYRLTARGEAEGRRTFLDEFEPYLARGTHGECGTADCACHRGGECQSLA
jgi:hydrogenase maturation protease